tara:strand:+ start:52 stop:987 length:936 start_codon:yes stop_codon:yes gene_type:complete
LKKKIINISIDIDNIHHYLKARNYEPTEHTKLGSIYNYALPRMLDLFEKYNIKATFFTVGEDALKYPDVIKLMHHNGHEIANHTLNHHQHFGELQYSDMEYEILECNKILEDITGDKVIGFRAPGWNINNNTLSILKEGGFKYDSSVFPSKLIPILNLFNYVTNKGRMKSNLGKNMKIGFASKKPYYPHLENFWKKSNQNEILEIPPTVVPFLNLPFLGTSLYKFGKPLFKVSKTIIDLYYDLILYELHAIELVGFEEVNDNRLSVKPGFKFSLKKKIDLYNYFLDSFKGLESKTLKEVSEIYYENSVILK